MPKNKQHRNLPKTIRQPDVSRTKALICLTIMVKNESKIITRCLDSCQFSVDFICLTDTGSTDNTIAIVREWAASKKIPCVVCQEMFQNFEYNRTMSYLFSKYHFPQATYFLLIDADMKLEDDNRNIITSKNKVVFYTDGPEVYHITQYSKTSTYRNIRMLKNDRLWICAAITHEFWAAYETGTENGYEQEVDFIIDDAKKNYPNDPNHLVFTLLNQYRLMTSEQDAFQREVKKDSATNCIMNDFEDGGCKSDKFIRDVKMISSRIDITKNLLINRRYHFYIAQSYESIPDPFRSIEFYKKRSKLGGYDGEIYYSFYKIGYLYHNLGWMVKNDIKKQKKMSVGMVSVDNAAEEDDNESCMEPVKNGDQLYFPAEPKFGFENQDELEDYYFGQAIYYLMKAWNFSSSSTEALNRLCITLRDNMLHNPALLFAEVGHNMPENTEGLFNETNMKEKFEMERFIAASWIPSRRKQAKEWLDKMIKLKRLYTPTMRDWVDEQKKFMDKWIDDGVSGLEGMKK